MVHSEEHARKVLSQEKDLKLQSSPVDELRVVRSTYSGLRYLPEDIRKDSPEGVVFYILNVCYAHAKNVAEGRVKDVIWGFRQKGIPSQITKDGLTILHNKGYLKWTDRNGIVLLSLGTNDENWYQWTHKFFNTLATKPEESINVPEYDLITNLKWEDVK